MGLKGVFQAAAKTAMSVAGDLKKSGTYTQVVDDGINAVSTHSQPLTVLFGEFTKDERDSSVEKVMSGDVKGMVIYEDLQVKPVRGDSFDDGVSKYKVVAFKHDPAEATWSLHLRTL